MQHPVPRNSMAATKSAACLSDTAIKFMRSRSTTPLVRLWSHPRRRRSVEIQPPTQAGRHYRLASCPSSIRVSQRARGLELNQTDTRVTAQYLVTCLTEFEVMTRYVCRTKGSIFHSDPKSELPGMFDLRWEPTKRQPAPGRCPGPIEGAASALRSYWLGKRSCENPVVFTSRKSGVRGGNKDGVRNSTSKV